LRDLLIVFQKVRAVQSLMVYYFRVGIYIYKGSFCEP
jgi:hypothetical protein